MENSLVLAPAPPEEECVSVGEEDYLPRARAECQRFISERVALLEGSLRN